MKTNSERLIVAVIEQPADPIDAFNAETMRMAKENVNKALSIIADQRKLIENQRTHIEEQRAKINALTAELARIKGSN